ncbi:MAG TPA: AMP-binding protein [Nocardioides sp.]|uniref:AMP-binding protein n=1 Tax=Nocardioides sp. TaxID=35761 RepID=UPI002ED93763
MVNSGLPAAGVIDAAARWLAAPEEPDPWVVETSGSTGRPKRVLLPRQAVLASARASASRLGASGAWLLALPPTYVAGLNVVVRSLLAGHRPVVAEDHGSFARAVEALPDGPRFVSLVPTQLRRLLETDAATTAALASFSTVLLGGGPIDPALRRRAADAGVRAVATYGSAETCGGCVYDGVPLDGVAVALGEAGRVRIAGPTLFAGYDGDPGLTAEVLVHPSTGSGGTAWFLTSDAGRLDEDGRLHLLGRLDDVVVTGGVNVPAPAVAARLREHVAVAEAEVLGVPDEEWGNRLVAFVVPESGVAGRVGSASDRSETHGLLEDLRDWVAAERPRSWAPRQLVVLDALPLLPNGKPDRVALRGLA